MMETQSEERGESHGIVWESRDDDRDVGLAVGHWLRDRVWSGLAVFASDDARAEAIRTLVEDFGATYIVDYRDAQGYGLCWALKWGEATSRAYCRPAARDRLPSVQRGRRDAERRRSFSASLFRNPGYDLVNDPIIEPPYA